MTYVPTHTNALRAPHGRKVADALAFFADNWTAFCQWRLRRQTERLIAGLSAETCKDIGWPSAADAQRSTERRLARM
ncbi:hypothetical protein M8R20_20775 [Pseudomonas sp. R2.Fl]|nr:hypothetical protein [Pseudomonas sp. R2.Fl]